MPAVTSSSSAARALSAVPETTIAGRFEDLAGHGQGGGLAGAGLADDDLDSRTRGGEAPHHRGLLDREMRMVVQQSR